ncbi:hypothetical protein TUM4641_22830 [Shewanella morhuae]|uniref:Uncharacterized protein n=2 Tax=Shewanella morhuae TaxID=365591 RepID=A0A379ZEL9_9GAMM|nr:hypothetical protein [Shewanella morhuae]GIU08601.1 hypothetical protein TUM4641_22830 [Shewanella morhuae]SUI59596.1 Uncharacterised protein [Shewanella morhuae]
MTASLRSYVRLSVTAIMIGGGVLLSGCASSPEDPLGCGTVSGYLQPDASTHWYRVVVTHLNGQAVVSKPNYQLAPGEYEFTVAELIDDPNLSVTVTARVPKVLKLNIQSHQRYHLGALLHTDKRYMGKDTAYWEPGVWLQEQHECQFELSPETK